MNLLRRVISRCPILVAGTILAHGLSLAAGSLNICDREVDSYYRPMETRRGFNRLESRGIRYRLRLVVELLPKSSVVDITASAASPDHKSEVRKLQERLDHCLSCEPVKSLLEKAKQTHSQKRKPTQVLTKAFNKGLSRCLQTEVSKPFSLSVDLFCDWKITDWR